MLKREQAQVFAGSQMQCVFFSVFIKIAVTDVAFLD